MRHRTAYRLAFFVFGLLLFPLTLQAEPKVGKAAPAICAVDAAGTAASLDEYKGQVVLVNVWASWCAPCLKELPQLDAMAGRLEGKGAAVLAVNIDDTRQKAERFAQKLNLKKVRVVFDEKKETPKALCVDSMPTSVIVDKQGVVRYVNAGYNTGDIEKMEKIILDLLK